MAAKDFDTGLRVRKAVLGDDYVDRSLANTDEFNKEFQTLLTEYCWGRVWGRSGLSRRQRSLNVLCMLAALNRPQEFETHVRGAMRNGCTMAELRETFLQVAVYCGMPAGVEAFRIARKVFAEQKAAKRVTRSPQRRRQTSRMAKA